MVNFGLNSASILGIFLAVAGAGLYFMRSVRPELSRDHDIFFAAVGLLCGLILLFQGWRLDPILQFGQFLLTGSAIFFAVETIRLRGVTTEQAKRGTPIVDDERRVSRTRVYTEAALDRLEPYEEEGGEYEANRRLRGYAEPRERRESSYSREEPRSPRNRRPKTSRDPRESSRKRRPRSPGDYSEYQQYDAWQDKDSGDTWEESATSRSPRRRPRPEPPESSSRPSRRRPRNSQENPRSSAPSDYSDYVDYQPIDEPASNPPNWEPQTKPESEGFEKGERNQDPPVSFDY